MGSYIFNTASTEAFKPKASVSIQRAQLGVDSYSTALWTCDKLLVNSTATINSLTVTSGLIGSSATINKFNSTAVTIAGGKINSTPIGATAASSGNFTTLTASSLISGTSLAISAGAAISSGLSASSAAFTNTVAANKFAATSGVSASSGNFDSITMTSLFYPVQYATTDRPTYVKGGVYFDITLNKLVVGGASTWETITSTAQS